MAILEGRIGLQLKMYLGLGNSGEASGKQMPKSACFFGEYCQPNRTFQQNQFNNIYTTPETQS